MSPSPRFERSIQGEQAYQPLLQPIDGRDLGSLEYLRQERAWNPQQPADFGRRARLDEEFLGPQEETNLTCQHSENSQRLFPSLEEVPEAGQRAFQIPAADRSGEIKNPFDPSPAHQIPHRLDVDLLPVPYKETELVQFLDQAKEVRTLKGQEKHLRFGGQ